MTTGPAVAALAGLPAGRLVDARGTSAVAVLGLAGVITGSSLMAFLPGWLGASGYVGGLAVLTAGYALFQAANITSVMAGAGPEHRGVISALLGLSRNLGLVTGASAMGAIFSLGSHGLTALGLSGSAVGLQVTFTVAALLGVVALAITLSHRRSK